jgi:pSer/pThr/pTyr-binding forkhead associated (FHA) protein
MSTAIPPSPHASTAVELKAQIDAERAGEPFLIYRDGAAQHHIKVLDQGCEKLTLGRRSSTDLAFDWDDEVSRLHAELVRKGDDWTLIDNGLSLNGSFVNGEPVRAQRRLHDGDALRLGGTVLIFRNPKDQESRATVPSSELRTLVNLTDAQRRVLFALCRPFKDSAAFVTPPTNEHIAGELYLSVDAVKKHMRGLFEKFDVQHLPQNEKRARLVERAFASGFISAQDL